MEEIAHRNAQGRLGIDTDSSRNDRPVRLPAHETDGCRSLQNGRAAGSREPFRGSHGARCLPGNRHPRSLSTTKAEGADAMGRRLTVRCLREWRRSGPTPPSAASPIVGVWDSPVERRFDKESVVDQELRHEDPLAAGLAWTPKANRARPKPGVGHGQVGEHVIADIGFGMITDRRASRGQWPVQDKRFQKKTMCDSLAGVAAERLWRRRVARACPVISHTHHIWGAANRLRRVRRRWGQ